MKTSTSPSPQGQWYLIDASGHSLGKLSASIAFVMRGKHKPNFSPHIPCRDHVVVVNAASLTMGKTGRLTKIYRRHSGHVGRLTRVPAAMLLGTSPEKLLAQSIKGMLPANRLRKGTLHRLHVYAGHEHPHGHHLLPFPSV